MRWLKVPDMRLLFPGSLLPQLDFVLVRRAPVVSTRQLAISPSESFFAAQIFFGSRLVAFTPGLETKFSDWKSLFYRHGINSGLEFAVHRSPFSVRGSGFSGAQSEHR